MRILLKARLGTETYSLYDDRKMISENKTFAEIAGHRSHGLSQWEVSSWAVRNSDLTVVKTHERSNDNSKAIYVVRDGRAAAVSYMHFRRAAGVSSSLEDIISGASWPGRWSDHVKSWVGRNNTLIVRYEDLVARPDEQLERVASFIDRPLEAGNIPSFEELRAIEPRFFRAGDNNANLQELSVEAEELFWEHEDGAMALAGYAGPNT